MTGAMYAAISGLKSHMQKLNVIGNNVANVNTYGYKAARTTFKESLYTTVYSGSNGTTSVGGVNPSQIGYGCSVGTIDLDMSTANYTPTGVDLDCMIDGTAFFIVGPYRDTKATPIDNKGIGKNGLFLSRVGIFQPDSNGYLVDNTGNYVYGYSATETNGTVTIHKDKLVPIRIPEKNPAGTAPAERYAIQTWTIGTDGTVVGVDDENIPHTIGQIAVASVENPSGLEQSNGYLYSIGANAGNVLAMQTTSATGTIKSNFLEMSNVDLASDIATMITTQRGYQANTKIITVTDEMLEQLVNMKR